MDYEKIRQKESQFLALTSPTTEESDHILPRFETELKRKYRKTSRGTARVNRFRWRGELPGAAHHLFFVLTYPEGKPDTGISRGGFQHLAGDRQRHHEGLHLSP